MSERPGWPSGAPISRGSTVSMIAFGGRRGPHRSGSRCRGQPIERREAGREGCLWPNAASQGRPPDGSGAVESVKASAPLQTAARRPLVMVVVVVVVRTPTPNYLRQTSQNLGKYIRNTAYVRWREALAHLPGYRRTPDTGHTIGIAAPAGRAPRRSPRDGDRRHRAPATRATAYNGSAGADQPFFCKRVVYVRE